MYEHRLRLYRKEALDHHEKKHQVQGDVLQLASAWTSWLYWCLAGVFAAGIVYSVTGRVNEYAEGPAVVNVQERTEVTAVRSGIVRSIEVRPGQHVEAGQLLVGFDSAQEVADLERVNREFDQQLINSLRSPTDAISRQALARLNAEREYIGAQLEERSVRAPHSGVVSDVRIRVGQNLPPGVTIVSLTGGRSELSVIALLPGRYRPQIKVGMPLRLELAGYRYAYQTLSVGFVSDEVVGPSEIRRFLSPEIADTVAVSEPVILVTANLPSRQFTSCGKSYAYYYGMHASASVQVRSERIIVALIPGLKYLLESTDE